MSAEGYGLNDPRAWLIDMNYHDISDSADKSWFARLDEKGYIDHLVSPEEIRGSIFIPPDTRARNRGEFIALCHKEPSVWSRIAVLNWDSVALNGYPYRIYFGEKNNPFLSQSSSLRKLYTDLNLKAD